MIEIGMGSVQVGECDVMGHMNVRHYVSRALDALASSGPFAGEAVEKSLCCALLGQEIAVQCSWIRKHVHLVDRINATENENYSRQSYGRVGRWSGKKER